TSRSRQRSSFRRIHLTCRRCATCRAKGTERPTRRAGFHLDHVNSTRIDAMKRHSNHPARHGAIIPMVAVCLVGLMGMVALAIDIGMVAIAKNQAQNAADTAACATVRTFTGQSGYNLAAAPIAGITAAKANTILGSAIACDPTNIANT